MYDSYEYDFNSLRVPVEVEGVRRLDTSLLFFLPAERRDFTDEMAEERIAILPPVLRVDILRSKVHLTSKHETTTCSSFNFPSLLDFTDTRYDTIFEPGCVRTKYVLVGMILGVFDSSKKTICLRPMRVRLPGHGYWIDFDTLRDLASFDMSDYFSGKVSKLISDKEALNVNGGKVGDLMPLQLLYMSPETGILCWPAKQGSLVGIDCPRKQRMKDSYQSKEEYERLVKGLLSRLPVSSSLGMDFPPQRLTHEEAKKKRCTTPRKKTRTLVSERDDAIDSHNYYKEKHEERVKRHSEREAAESALRAEECAKLRSKIALERSTRAAVTKPLSQRGVSHIPPKRHQINKPARGYDKPGRIEEARQHCIMLKNMEDLRLEEQKRLFDFRRMGDVIGRGF